MNPLQDQEQIKDIKKQIGFYSRLAHKIIKAQDINFWVFASFLPTFALSRFTVYFFPDLFLSISGVHIHHLSYGIFFLSLSGLFLLNMKKEFFREPLAIMFGMGLALVFDEFSLWLHLEDEYWTRQSYDAIVLITSSLFALVYLPDLYRSAKNILSLKENKIKK